MRAYNKILFVCKSGTLRAPMAEAILKGYRLNQPMEIGSRGMIVLFPEPINQKAEAVLISNGLDMKNYMSIPLVAEDFSEDTLVIVMEETHRMQILRDFPKAEIENVQVLTQIVGDELEIMDPYGGILTSYGLCYETLNKSIKKLVDKINEGE